MLAVLPRMFTSDLEGCALGWYGRQRPTIHSDFSGNLVKFRYPTQNLDFFFLGN